MKNKFIRITQEILDYVESRKAFFDGLVLNIGDKWNVERIHTYPCVNGGNPVIEVNNDRGEWMRLPNDIVDMEIRSKVGDTVTNKGTNKMRVVDNTCDWIRYNIGKYRWYDPYEDEDGFNLDGFLKDYREMLFETL